MGTRRHIALSRRELYRRVWSQPLSMVAKDLGLSSNALAKICNRLLVPHPSRGYWAKAGVGKASAKPPLPPAPEASARQLTISATRAASRRARTRLDPSVRHEQLLDVAVDVIRKQGLHAASMKQIAAAAGISETQAYNYFGSRENLFVAIARREFSRIQQARQADMAKANGFYSVVAVTTRAYLRQIDERGGLLQMLLSSPGVRATLRKENRVARAAGASRHAQNLANMYGVSHAAALAGTVVLSRLCLRTGKLIADRRISLEWAERLCLPIVLNGTRAVLGPERNGKLRGTQGLKAA